MDLGSLCALHINFISWSLLQRFSSDVWECFGQTPRVIKCTEVLFPDMTVCSVFSGDGGVRFIHSVCCWVSSDVWEQFLLYCWVLLVLFSCFDMWLVFLSVLCWVFMLFLYRKRHTWPACLSWTRWRLNETISDVNMRPWGNSGWTSSWQASVSSPQNLKKCTRSDMNYWMLFLLFKGSMHGSCQHSRESL